MKRGQPTVHKQGQRKSKSKSKSKEKKPKFDPLEYLNSLIDELHEHQHTRRKGSTSHKRQLASAMAHTTPYTERTAASSKVRSKSSYSQFRKKSATIKEVLKIDLNAVTEDDNIQFTENTIRDTDFPSAEKVEPVIINRNVAARKIQRAWRNYQTLKVVRKYYEYYRDVYQREAELKELESNYQRVNVKVEETKKKQQSKHQLKIKRKQDKGSPIMKIKLSQGEKKTMDFSDQLIESKTNKKQDKQKEQSFELGPDPLRTIELPILKQPEIKAESSKDLELIMEMFKSKEESVSKQIEQQLSAYCKAQADLVASSQMSPSRASRYEDRGSSLFRQEEQSSILDLQGLSPAVFTEMENAVRSKYQVYRLRIQQQSEHDRGDFMAKNRAFQQLQGRLLRQLRSIEKCRQQYMRSVSQLREGMLKMQNDTAIVSKMTQVPLRVRKSYSAESLLLKSILEEASFRTIDLEVGRSREDLGMMLSEYRGKGKHEELPHLAIPTSPPSQTIANIQNANNSNLSANRSNLSVICYQLDSANKLREVLQFNQSENYPALQDNEDDKLAIHDFTQKRQSPEAQSPISPGILQNCDSTSSLNVSLQEMSNKEGDRSRMVRECSQELEVEIEAVLVWEFVEELYTKNRLWSNFKSLVEAPFMFKIVDDLQIQHFLTQQLPPFYIGNVEWLTRMNQKINPTSLEILKLIRDFDFQIQQYELILPEEVFKAYRRQLQDRYGILIKEEQNKAIVIDSQLTEPMKELVNERALDKRSKRAKFLSFQRDLRIMYMKAVFNCFNELIIQTKSFSSYMHGRSSIGPGQLTLALKQYNDSCGQHEARSMMEEAREKVMDLINNKCSIPEFKNSRDLQLFQRQMGNVVARDLAECEYKWVNYMDEVLELWQDISLWLMEELMNEVVRDCMGLEREV